MMTDFNLIQIWLDNQSNQSFVAIQSDMQVEKVARPVPAISCTLCLVRFNLDLCSHTKMSCLYSKNNRKKTLNTQQDTQEKKKEFLWFFSKLVKKGQWSVLEHKVLGSFE